MSIPADITPAELQAIMEGPALPPPPGVQFNFDNPYTFGTAVLVDEIIFLVLSTMAIVMHVYTKLRIIRDRRPEDYLAVIAWTLFVADTAVGFTCGYPVGRHQWDIKFKDMKAWLYHLHVGAVMYGAVCFTIKLAILLQYIRIFSSKQRGAFFWTCHALIILNFIFYTTCFFMEIFNCSPIAKAWDPMITYGHCIDYLTLNTVSAAFNSASDFVIFLLPQPLIWKLHMSFRKRLGVSLIFAVALLACVSAVIRLYYSVRLGQAYDESWYVSLMSSFVFPELGLGIVIICLPTIPKFFKSVADGSAFSRITTTAGSHLNSHKSGTSKQQSTHSKPRRDSFDRLVDDYELNGPSGKSNTGQPVIRELKDQSVPQRAQILRTVDVRTESQPQHVDLEASYDYEDRPWEGTHKSEATISRT